jgi:hypothetical protein
MKEFFELLFEPGEGICTGDAYAVGVSTWANENPFFCVNPLALHYDHLYYENDNRDEYTGRRADINVTSLRNFMFEMDDLPLEDQLNLFRNSKIPFTSLVFSGSKSFHAVLALESSIVDVCHTVEAIEAYKLTWRRLAAQLDEEAVRMGFKLPVGAKSFIDHSCKNPSRLTRYPDYKRENGKFQSLIMLTHRMAMDEFNTLLEECPKVSSSEFRVYETPEELVENIEHFKAICPVGLLRKLTIPDWASHVNMYPELRDVTLWAIDSTNVSKETFLEFLNQYTFKTLLRRGYPENKLQIAIDHSYKMKGK